MHVALEIMRRAGEKRAEHEKQEAAHRDVQDEKRPIRSLPFHDAGVTARFMSAHALGTLAGNRTGRIMSSGNRKPSGA